MTQATSDPAAIWQWWNRTPNATLILPTGLAFDVLDVPERAGWRALDRLERMGTPLGPVAACPTGRVLFFVAPDTTGKLPHLLRRLGWDDIDLDLRCHGKGSYVFAPPSSIGGFGTMQWLRPPTHTNRQCPEARLLLGTIAYSCHRSSAVTAAGLWRAS
jgi:Bifunctional DNA primase/polymerase, N-terminal